MTTLVDVYLRLSDGRDLTSIEARERMLRGEAANRGWTVNRVVIENDLSNGKSKNASAFKRRKITLPDGSEAMRTVRPGFRSILDDLANGRVTALLAEDLDRVVRDPRDGEDLLDVIERVKGTADSVSDSLKLTNGGTDSEIYAFRSNVNAANKASKDIGRRVKAGRARQSAQGYFRGGRRPYGYRPVPNPDGKYQNSHLTIVPDEADELRRAYEALMSDVPLRSICRDMNERNVPTPIAVKWVSTSIRDMLKRELNTGKEDANGQTLIPAIFTPDEHRNVIEKLGEPVKWTDSCGNEHTAPRANVGRAPCWLGSGLYLCECGATMEISGGVGRAPAYRCSVANKAKGSIHVRRNAAHVDDFVAGRLIARMAKPDAAAYFVPAAPDIDVNGLRGQVTVLNRQLREWDEDRTEGRVTRARWLTQTEKINAKLTAIAAQLTQASDTSPLGPLLGAEGVEAIAKKWESLSLGAQRAAIGFAMVVTIRPTSRKGAGFDDSAVEITNVDGTPWPL